MQFKLMWTNPEGRNIANKIELSECVSNTQESFSGIYILFGCNKVSAVTGKDGMAIKMMRVFTMDLIFNLAASAINNPYLSGWASPDNKQLCALGSGYTLMRALGQFA
jgi:hypothetical protein